ncbi:ATP synthase F1 subunit epsilon [Nannocystaceae bacterium ST9]
MAATITLDILTPNGRVDLRASAADQPGKEQGPIEVEGVLIPAALGELGVLPGHIPFLTPVVPGVVSFRLDGADRRIAVGQGFLEISETGEVSLLTERVARAWEIDVEKARAERAELDEALKAKTGAIDDVEIVKLRHRFEWLDAQLRAVQAG